MPKTIQTTRQSSHIPGCIDTSKASPWRVQHYHHKETTWSRLSGHYDGLHDVLEKMHASGSPEASWKRSQGILYTHVKVTRLGDNRYAMRVKTHVSSYVSLLRRVGPLSLEAAAGANGRLAQNCPSAQNCRGTP